MKLFHLRTDNVQCLKKLIDALKELMIETNMCFSKKSINISHINSKGSIYCFLEIRADMVNNEENFYHCDFNNDNPLSVGVNLLHLAKILKCIGSNNILHLETQKYDKNTLNIKVENTNKSEMSLYSMKYIEINEEKLSIPDVEFETILKLNSKYFQKIIKDICSLDAKYVDIKFCSGQLFISGIGGYIFRETIIEESTGKNNIMSVDYVRDENNISQGKFDIKDLITISKFTGLSKTLTIKMKNDIPLVIELEIDNIGNLVLLITLKT